MALEGRWITREMATAAKLRRVSNQEGRTLVGDFHSGDMQGILIPYMQPDGSDWIPYYRIRRDYPELTPRTGGGHKPEKKYVGPPQQSPRLYFPPGVTSAQLRDTTLPVIIPEGEFKDLALARLAVHPIGGAAPEKARLLPVGIGGVWNWRCTTGKVEGPDGTRVAEKGMLPDFDLVAFEDRNVIIAFDADYQSNANVRAARAQFARALRDRGANVGFLIWSLDDYPEAKGVDDWLATSGPETVLAALQQALEADEPKYEDNPYSEHRKRLLWWKPTVAMDEKKKSIVIHIPTTLTNFGARIKNDITVDNGVDRTKLYEIEARLPGRRPERIEVSAKDFESMAWVAEKLGSNAIVYPHLASRARTAIQELSLPVPEVVSYSHTGWVRINGDSYYLHAGGGIGTVGLREDINTSLPDKLSKYRLPAPVADRQKLRHLLRRWFDLLEVNEDRVVMPVLAAPFRAVIKPAEFSIFLYGRSGAGKSELAALAQQHFGPEMHAKALPGSWQSTANALLMQAFTTKDAVFTIDDFLKQGSFAEQQKLNALADRIFRAAGNQSDRGRLTADARLMKERPPRGLIVSTGEHAPQGMSLNARLVMIPTERKLMNWTLLSDLQERAAGGELAKIMSSFLQWAASRIDSMQKRLAEALSEERRNPTFAGQHNRTADNLRQLAFGFEIFTEFAEQCGAVNAVERAFLLRRLNIAFAQLLDVEAEKYSRTDPAKRIVLLLAAAIRQGEARLDLFPEGGRPSGKLGWGWGDDRAGDRATRVGWVCPRDMIVYLDPTGVKQALTEFSTTQGESIPESVFEIGRELKEADYLHRTDPGRRSTRVRRRINGAQVEVWAMTVRKFQEASLENADNADNADNDQDEQENVGIVGNFLGTEEEILR